MGDSQGGHPLESYFSLLNFLFVEKKRKFRPRMHGRAGSGASDQAQRPERLRSERLQSERPPPFPHSKNHAMLKMS